MEEATRRAKIEEGGRRAKNGVSRGCAISLLPPFKTHEGLNRELLEDIKGANSFQLPFLDCSAEEDLGQSNN